MRGPYHIMRLPRYLLMAVIWGYQKTISPDHGPLRRFFPDGYCRFFPSCSSYMYTAVEKLGIIRGSPKGIWRILRCNPWSQGGIDEINET